MGRKYTVQDLENAYENRRETRAENGQNGDQNEKVVSRNVGREYTVEDLEADYQRNYGKTSDVERTLDNVAYKDYGKTAQQIAIDKMRNSTWQMGDNRDKYGMFDPHKDMMNASLKENIDADKFGASPWIAKSMNDDALNVAIGLLQKKRTETQQEAMNTAYIGQMAGDELTGKINGYNRALDVYEREKETRDTAREKQEVNTYYNGRESVLNNLPKEAQELIDTYYENEATYTSNQFAGIQTGGVDPLVQLKYQTAMQDARNKLISDYGISEDEVDKVLLYGKEVRDEESTQNVQEQIRTDIAEHPVGYGTLYSVADLMMSPATGLMAATESLKALGYADKKAPVNINSAEYMPMNISNATEQAVNEEINNPVGQFVYNVGMSTGKSAISAAIGGKITGALGLTGKAATVVGNIVILPQFGASAYASTLQEDQEKGISTENATKHAVAAGVGEMLFEVVSLDKVWEIAGRSGKATASQVLKDALVQAGIEGSEEGFTDIWDRVADDIINGDKSAYNMNVKAYMENGYSEEDAREMASKDFYGEVFMDVLAGAVSGGIMAGGANAVAEVNYHNLGKYVDSNTELKKSVYDAAQSMEDDSVTKQIVQEKSVEELTASDMADIMRAMTEESEMNTEQILQNRLVELGENQNQARADARKIIEAVSTESENVSEEENEARSAEFAENENLGTVYAETLKGELTKQQDAIRAAQESYESSKKYNNLVRRGKTNQTGVARATIKDTGADAIVVEIQNISNGKATVRMSDNSYRDLGDIQIEDPVKQSLYNFATTMEDANVANAVIEEYNGQSLPSYAEACAVFYNAGKVGATSFESMMSNPKNSALVSNMSSPATLKMMYTMGENNRSAKKTEVAPVQPKKSGEQSAKKAVKRKEGKVIDNRTDKSDNRMRDVVERVAKKTGLEITLNDALEHGENGHFQKALSRIALSETADNQYATLIHEINEFAESYNPEGMKKVIDTALDYAQIQEGAAFLFGKENGIIQRYQDVYKKRVEADKTYEGAAEEFVFDYLSGIFSTREGIEDFSRYMTEEGMSQKEQKGILETIADFFKELADKITSYLDEHVLSSTAKKGLQADAEKASEIRQMVMEVWQQAEENYKENNKIEDSTEKFSLNVFGLEEYTEHEKGNWKNADIVYANTEEDIAEFVKTYVRTNSRKRMYCGKIGTELAEKIFEDTGLHLDNYNVAINSWFENSHADSEKEKLRGQVAITPDIVAKMPMIISRYDNVIVKGYTDGSRPVLEFTKDIDGKKVLIEFASKRRKTLDIQTMYGWAKKKTSHPAADAKASARTSETNRDMKSSTNIISQNTENTTKKYSIDVDSDGRKLSEGQKAYFKDSKVRDDDGRLLVMYHGSNSEFTIFDISKGGKSNSNAGVGFWFTETNEGASNFAENIWYGDTETPKIYEVYLNVKKPKVYKTTDGRKQLKMLSSQYDELNRKKYELENRWYYPEIRNFVGYSNYSDSEIDEILQSYFSKEEKRKNFIDDLKKYNGILKEMKSVDQQMSEARYNDSYERFRTDIYKTVGKTAEDANFGGTGMQLDNKEEVLEKFRNKLIAEGYDGIIIEDTEYDANTMGGKNTQYVAFYPSQIKNVSNINPTDNPDIRYSIDIDDSLFDALKETYSIQEKEIASIVQEGFESLKNVTVNEKVMHKVAYDIKKEYQSKYDIDKLQENLTRVFAYLKDHADSVGYEDMVRIVQEIAKPVIEQSTDVDAFEQEIYNNFRSYLKGMSIRLSEEQKAEVAYYYGSYENFRKKNFGNITFSDEGTYLDNIWSEICDNSYQMLDTDISSVDEPIALIDALNTLRPTKKNIYGMDTEQAAYDLALDIYRRFFVEQAEEKANQAVYKKTQRLIARQQEYRKRVKQEYDASLQRLREVEQQKRKNLAEKYEQKIHDLKEDQKQILAYKDVKASNAVQRKIDYYTKAVVDTNQKANDRILQIKASNRQNMLNKRRNEELRRYRERIKKNAQGIVTMFNTNTDKKHVPEALKVPVANFITSIDFISERASTDSAATMAWEDALNQMHRKLSDRKAAVDGGYIELYDALHDWESGDKKTSALLSDMSYFIDSNSGVKVSEMNIEQLKQLDEMITGLKRAIANVNQLYVNKRTKNVQELGNSTISELSEKKKKKSRTQIGDMAENLLDVSMLDARSYFYRLGDSAFSIYEGLRNGFSERVWMLKEAQQYMEKELSGMDVKKWTGDNAEVHEIIIRGKELYMTTGQIMSLYELKNRYQAKVHLRHGGIRPSKIGKGKGAIERITPLKLTDYEIDLICQKLTPEQKKAADAMQRFMAENCAEWGNKTSMLMYGYKRFGASNYFPIKTDGNSVDTRDDSKYYGTKNQGFTKETTKNASNALIVSDIFDVFTKHVSDMASYSAFTAPLMDAMKWFNYRSVSYDGEIASYDGAVKSEIERAYGTRYLEYFKKLIQDINAETTKGFEAQISDTLTSRMKAASVGANLRVAIQQPTAYVRAMAVMNPKYLLQAVPKKAQIKKAKENSAITQWKSWGYFETSIGKSMKNVITGQDSLKNKVVEKSMALAQLGDDVTWGYLWNACEAEIKDKHPDVTYDSKEFLKLVSDRFDEVVDQTQVVDSVLHRSHIMRSENGIVKMATSFMAEPTKSYNMLMNQIRDVSEGGGTAEKKRLARATTAYVLTNLLNAVIVSLIDAARDMDDDDDTYWERYAQALGENIVDNMNPLGMIPYVKDILSMLNGYDVSRMDMQGISNLISGGQMIVKYINDEEYRQKHTLLDVSKTMIRGASQVLGLPAYNLLRDVESVVYTITGMRLGGIKRSNTRNYEIMVDAIISGDKERYEESMTELEEKEIGEDQIQEGIRKEVKERYLTGELTQEETEQLLVKEGGVDENEAYWKLRDWDYKKQNPDAGSGEYKYLYDAIDYAFETGAINDRDLIQKEITLLLEHGKTKESVMEQITGHYKAKYLEMKASGKYADMKNLLISAYMMLELSKNEAMKKIDGWEEVEKE